MIAPQVLPTPRVRVLAARPAETAATPVQVEPVPVAAAHVVPRQATAHDAPRRVTLAQAQAALRALDHVG